MVPKLGVKTKLNSVRYVYSLVLSSLLSSASLEGRLEDVDPIALTSQGQLLGKFGDSRNSRDFIMFLGIPYAKVPQTFHVRKIRSFKNNLIEKDNFELNYAILFMFLKFRQVFSSTSTRCVNCIQF